MTQERRRFEVHGHTVVTGPRANRWDASFDHAHVGGDRGHAHPDTGPACFTIDRDDWLRATGLKGGARRRYSRKPVGPAMALVALAPWQRTFEVIGGQGVAMARMVMAYDMEPIVVDSPTEAKDSDA